MHALDMTVKSNRPGATPTQRPAPRFFPPNLEKTIVFCFLSIILLGQVVPTVY